jgi:hypothetical protein
MTIMAVPPARTNPFLPVLILLNITLQAQSFVKWELVDGVHFVAQHSIATEVS